MTALNIYSLDDLEEQNIIASLPLGEYTIGRGGILHVTDKRVSRKHAVINVTNDKITLTSIHINPCFFKAFDGKNLTVLSQNQESELNNGDQFALLPEHCWFKVKIKREEPQPNGKRSLEANQEENDDLANAKKVRLSTDMNESIFNDTSHDDKPTNFEENNSSLNLEETARIEDLKANNSINNEVKQEPAAEISNESNDKNATAQIKEEPDDNAQDSGQSTSTAEIKKEPQPQNTKEAHPSLVENTLQAPNNDNSTKNDSRRRRRERCWYADRCFRKNPNHRINFSHPGDQDYEPDPDDDRPDCPYGATCYRKNIDHRQEYKHPAPPAPGPSNVNLTVRVAGTCPYCQHCNTMGGVDGAGKQGYESDVDE